MPRIPFLKNFTISGFLKNIILNYIRGDGLGIVKYSESVLKKFKWYDVKLAQLAAIFATLTLITAWPDFLEMVLKFEWYWYLIVAFIFGAPLIKKMIPD